jgi:hypothetical protein
MQRRGARDVSREDLCKLVELVTNIGGDASLGSGFFSTVKDVLQHLLNEKRKLGADRAQGLSLPPDWRPAACASC